MIHDASLLVDSRSLLGEGAWYDFRTETLIWIDIFGCRIHKYNSITNQDQSWIVDKPVTTIVPIENGGYILGTIDGISRIDDRFEEMNSVLSPDMDFSAYRCNDGKCDPQGRFWIGIMEREGKRRAGKLFCCDGQKCRLGLSDLDVPNGIAWNSRGDTVYFTDTINAEIYAFDFFEGNLAGKRTIYKADTGMTDGMTIDEEDKIWVAVWGTGKVLRIDPEKGRVIDTISVDVPNVSSVSVANGKVYITTASIGMSESEKAFYPTAGGLYAADVCLQGVQLPRFKGKSE